MPRKQRRAQTTAQARKREEQSPRYIQIARDLRAAIAAGRYPLGAQLPTEHELCEKLGVSRGTIREAVRVLASAGLVRRKPRAGTIVVALPDDSQYTHSVASLHDLTQYAQETTLDYMYVGRIGLSRAQARSLHAKPGDEWIYAIALRREARDAAPLGVSRLFLNPAFKGIERALRGSPGPVYSIIERDFGARIERVEQVIAGIALDELDAENLGVAAGTPGLAITRTYFDDEGRVAEYVENVHPADRFTYRLQLTR